MWGAPPPQPRSGQANPAAAAAQPAPLRRHPAATAGARPPVAPPPITWSAASHPGAQAKRAAAGPATAPLHRPAPGAPIAPPAVVWGGGVPAGAALQAKPSTALRAAAHSSGFPGPRAGAAGSFSHPAPKVTAGWPGVIQRAYQSGPPTAPSFPVTSFASGIFGTFGDKSQSDLAGDSSSSGRQNFYGVADAQKSSNRARYVTATSSVLSFLKINGQEVNFGENGKAGKNKYFHDVGYENQSGLKENFHAEDWCLESFRDAFGRSGQSLNDYVNAYWPPTGNSGQPGKHVFSMAINFSSCLGCVATIREFRNWLERELGQGKLLFRIKFLRPYKLPETAKNPQSQTAENFISSIGGLIDEGIFVRMQTQASAQHLLSSTAISTTIPDVNKLAVNHSGVQNILEPDQFAWLNKTWTEQGANRKGPAPLSPTTGPICGAPTKTGAACKRPVSNFGDKCWHHQ